MSYVQFLGRSQAGVQRLMTISSEEPALDEIDGSELELGADGVQDAAGGHVVKLHVVEEDRNAHLSRKQAGARVRNEWAAGKDRQWRITLTDAHAPQKDVGTQSFGK